MPPFRANGGAHRRRAARRCACAASNDRSKSCRMKRRNRGARARVTMLEARSTKCGDSPGPSAKRSA
ncbi:hypothetical protein A8H35_22980 [Burkholderia thailandensis]|nr:hypothetical protein WJ27_28575 [Burkholderia thailandensis]AVR07518.1 hypothetical protein A8H31_08550 [Burkholderia thailandensis]AWY61113.1 hypothetical protein A8H35_22980 [Burkholderia thailandensis]AWY65189.1 hypothetical protein A8H36_08125 [Burkholderia thailandensis]KVG12898.1 hypothetical protein WJ25_00330 [Burkholderia thailandensis]